MILSDIPQAAEKPWQNTLAWLRSRRAEGLLRMLIVAATGLFLLLFLYAAARRMRYPFDLEWVESGILVSVQRLVHHEPLYAPPTLGYVAYLYAPLYFYICALVAKFTGVSFLALRLVSILGALGTMAVLFAFVYRETRDTFCGIAAVGVFASLYAFVGAWFDIGRVDSLFLFFFLLALYCTRFAPPWVAAVAWVLAFQTKQSAIAFAIPMLLTYWEPRRKSRVVVALGTYAVLAWGSIQFFNHLNGGWYKFYVFGAAAGLPSVIRMAAMFISEVVLAPLAVVTVVIAAGVLFAPPSLRSRATVFYVMGSGTIFFGMWWVHAHRGVGNSMLALYVWMALLFGIALHRLMAVNKERSSSAEGLTVVLLLAVLAQLGSQLYNPGQFLPPATERAGLEGLEAQIRAIPGDVYVMNHSWDAVLAGKQPHAEGEAIGAIVDAGGPRAQQFKADLRQAMLDHQFAALVLDDGDIDQYTKWLTPEELAAYPVHVAASGSNLPRFLTSQPQMILLPCSALSSGLAARISPDGLAPPAPRCRGDSLAGQ